MENFLNDIFSLPTLIFAFPLVIFILFWLVSAMGLADPEILDFDLDGDSDGDTANNQSWLAKLGLDGAPLMVGLTLIDIYGFVFSYLIKKHLMPLMDGLISGVALGTSAAVIALLLALPFAALTIKPLRRVFHTHEAISKNELTGTICLLSTSKVSDSFGQAVTLDGSMVLNVRADVPNTIKKDDRLALIEYNSQNDSYFVVTEQQLHNQ